MSRAEGTSSSKVETSVEDSAVSGAGPGTRERENC
jgi:hypothetical protein